MSPEYPHPPYMLSEENPCEIYPKNGGHIVAVATLPFSAGFIVKACNSHELLIAALRCIACQSVGPDWSAEQALAFIKQHAFEALDAA